MFYNKTYSVCPVTHSLRKVLYVHIGPNVTKVKL